MTRALPDNPDLLFERKQAKTLLKAFRAGDPAAVTRMRDGLPRLRDDEGPRPTLADAQFVIARERGFPSWTRLKAHFEAEQSIDQQAERFLRAMCAGHVSASTRLLAQVPAIAGESIHAACAAADADAVAAWLARDPANVSQRRPSSSCAPRGCTRAARGTPPPAFGARNSFWMREPIRTRPL